MKKLLTRIISSRLNDIVILILGLYTIFSLLLYYNILSANEYIWHVSTIILIIAVSTLVIILICILLILKLHINIKKNISKMFSIEFKQFESLIFLHTLIKSEISLKTRGWAASPDLISAIFKNIIKYKPSVILELGSGISSQFIGHLLKVYKFETKLISLDHSSEYSEKTKSDVLDSGLDEYIEIIHCPLKKIIINENEWIWYNLENLSIPEVDLLIIDGPIGEVNKKTRYPAIPVLINKLKDNAIIILDDYNRIDEKEIVKDWLRENASLKLIEEIDTEKGTAILKKLPNNK